MHPIFLPRGRSVATVPVTFVNAATWRELRETLDSRARAFVDAAGFEPKAGRHCLLPSAQGGLAGILFALERPDEPNKDLFWPGALPALLPTGAYRFATPPHDARLAAIAFALGAYRFARYRKQDDKEFRLELPGNVDGEAQISARFDPFALSVRGSAAALPAARAREAIIAERRPATTGFTSLASVHTAATPIVPAPTKRTL